MAQPVPEFAALAEFHYRVRFPATSFMPGHHASQVRGGGIEAAALVPLARAREPRRLDWRASLRDPFQGWWVREHHQRSSLLVLLLADVSASMGFAGRGDKQALLAGFAQSLRHSVARTGNAFGQLAFDTALVERLRLPPTRSRQAAAVAASALAGHALTGRGAAGLCMVAFTHAWVLWGLPLALLPLWRGRRADATAYPWLDLVPRDGWSTALDWARRLAAALAIAATLASLAGPYRAEERVERMGQGAEIVLVLDRSMDEEPVRGVNNLIGRAGGYDAESKSAAARRVVSQFTAQRPHEAFGLVLFSNVPIPFLPFTQRQEVIQAALAAGSVGKGLGDTDIGRALLAGAAYFEARPYVGSRILLLISDGGARLDTGTRERIAAALKRHRIGIYWLYLVGRWGRRLVLDGSLDGPAHAAERDALPGLEVAPRDLRAVPAALALLLLVAVFAPRRHVQAGKVGATA